MTAGVVPELATGKVTEHNARTEAGLPPNRVKEHVTRWLLLCGVLAPPLLAIFFVSVGVVTPDFSFISETISQLGARGMPYPGVMNSGFIVCGVLLILFALGLYLRLGRSVVAKAVWLLLAIEGICIVLSGVYQTDSPVPGITCSAEGNLHCIFSLIAFFVLPITMAVFLWITYRRPAWRGLTRISITVLVLNLLLFLVFMIVGADRIAGAMELSFFGISLVWLEAVSLRSLRLPAYI